MYEERSKEDMTLMKKTIMKLHDQGQGACLQGTVSRYNDIHAWEKALRSCMTRNEIYDLEGEWLGGRKE